MATDTRVPTGNSAVANDFTASAGNRWECVDDPVGSPNDATDFVFKQNSNGTQRFTHAAFSIPGGSTINSVTVRFRAQRTAAGACTLAPMIRVGSTNTTGTSQAMTTSWADYFQTWATNPNTASAWTVDQVNGVDATNPLSEFGVNSGGLASGEEVQLTQIYIEVDYTAAAAGNPWYYYRQQQ